MSKDAPKPPAGLSGMAAALQGVVAGQDAGDDETTGGEQVSFAFAEPPEPDEIGAKRSGPGRPPGAKNKTTTEWADYLNARFRSPLVGMSQIAEMHPLALMSWGFDSIEKACAFWLGCCREVARYRHSPMPISAQVDVGGQVAISFSVGAPPEPGHEPGRVSDAVETTWATVTPEMEDEQIQGLSRKMATALETNRLEETTK